MIKFEEVMPLVWTNRWFSGRLFRVREQSPYPLARMQWVDPIRWRYEVGPTLGEEVYLPTVRTYPLANSFGIDFMVGPYIRVQARGRTPCHFACLDGDDE